jgi:hypothetical protein
VILSASRRTDVPALYAPWLAARLRAGWCDVPHPYDPRRVSRVSLRREEVDAWVFWTRHARPFLPLLPLLDSLGHRFYVHYTITGLGRPVEARNPPVATAIATLLDLAARLRPGSVVWRFDPILVGPEFPAAETVRRFRRIAAALETGRGAVRRVVVSILEPYRKTRRRLGAVLRWGEDLAEDPRRWPGRHELLAALAAAAQEHGLAIEACAHDEDFTALGVPPTKCVDDRLLAELFGGTWPSAKDPGQRPACRCLPSRDLGVPDTCTFGCTYCYATRSDDLARRRCAAHDPSAPSLADPRTTSPGVLPAPHPGGEDPGRPGPARS